jgi:hypothetical protein
VGCQKGLVLRRELEKRIRSGRTTTYSEHRYFEEKRWINWLARETSFGGRLDIEKKQWFTPTVTEFEFSLGVLDAYTNNERIEG